MHEAHTELEKFQPLIIYLVLVLCSAPDGKLTYHSYFLLYIFQSLHVVSTAVGTNEGLVFINFFYLSLLVDTNGSLLGGRSMKQKSKDSLIRWTSYVRRWRNM